MWVIKCVIFASLWCSIQGGFQNEPCSDRNTLYLTNFNFTRPKFTIQCVDLSFLDPTYVNRKHFLNRIKLIRNIQTLYADRVGFRRPPSVAALQDLEEIDLSGNRIRRMDQHFFEDNPKLRLVLLADNHISITFLHPFLRSKSIETLVLSGNEIGALYHNTFIGLPALKVLELDGNKISKVSYDVFKTNMLLRYVQLRRNPLYSLTIYKPRNLQTLLYDRK